VLLRGESLTLLHGKLTEKLRQWWPQEMDRPGAIQLRAILLTQDLAIMSIVTTVGGAVPPAVAVLATATAMLWQV